MTVVFAFANEAHALPLWIWLNLTSTIVFPFVMLGLLSLFYSGRLLRIARSRTSCAKIRRRAVLAVSVRALIWGTNGVATLGMWVAWALAQAISCWQWEGSPHANAGAIDIAGPPQCLIDPNGFVAPMTDSFATLGVSLVGLATSMYLGHRYLRGRTALLVLPHNLGPRDGRITSV